MARSSVEPAREPCGLVDRRDGLRRVARAFGGVAEGDAAVGIHSTWAIARGHLARAYPPSRYFHGPPIVRPDTSITPFYSIFAGPLAAMLRVGHAVPFPTTAQLGYHCANAYDAIYHWSVASISAMDTMRVRYASGAALLAGVWASLSVAGHGQRLREPVTMLAVVSAPVVACLLEFYHCQDLVAMGLSLLAVAVSLRQRWVWSGVAVGLAITTRQFALLVAAPLFSVAPAQRRWWFAAAITVAGAAVDLPFLLARSGRAFRAVVVGLGLTLSYGGTVMWELGLHGATSFLAMRVANRGGPLALVVGAAAPRCRYPRADDAGLTGRDMPGATTRLRREPLGLYFHGPRGDAEPARVGSCAPAPTVVAWLLTVLLAFDPLPSGFQSN